MIVTLYVSYLSHLLLMTKVQLLNALSCFMIVLIVFISVDTLLGWLYVASVVVGCTGWIVWLTGVADSTGTPVLAVPVISILISGTSNWLNPYMISLSFSGGAIGKLLLLLDRSTYKSYVSITCVSYSLLTCPTCSLSSAGKRQFKRS